MDIVLTNIEEVEQHLLRNEDCSQLLLDTIVQECKEIEDRGNNFNLIGIENSIQQVGEEEGFILDEFEGEEDEPLNTTKFLFGDY